MKKILIIEDDRVLSEELSRLLGSAGYDAARITEFRDVTAQMHKADADLILLDINLPGIGGETLLQEFRLKKQYARHHADKPYRRDRRGAFYELRRG